MKKSSVAAFAAMLLAGTILAPSVASAGSFILAGTDADDHGFVQSGANQEGWFFMQRSLESLAPTVTNGRTAVVALGSDPGTQAGQAAASAFSLSNLGAQGFSFQNINGALAISTFLSAGAQGCSTLIKFPRMPGCDRG